MDHPRGTWRRTGLLARREVDQPGRNLIFTPEVRARMGKDKAEPKVTPRTSRWHLRKNGTRLFIREASSRRFTDKRVT